jgi:cobalt/nickel transport system permease protein
MKIEDLYNYNHRFAKVHLAIKAMYITPAFILSIISSSLWFHLSVFVLFFIGALIIAKISFLKYLKLISIPGMFILLGCLTLLLKIEFNFIGEGTFKFNIGIDKNTYPIALGILFKSYALVSIVYFWLLTHTISEISQSMFALKIPKLFIELFVLTYKLIYLLTHTTQTMLISQKCRLGYVSVKQNSINLFAYLFSAVFKKSLQQTEHIEIAMSSRLGTGNYFFLRPKLEFSFAKMTLPIMLFVVLFILFYIF